MTHQPQPIVKVLPSLPTVGIGKQPPILSSSQTLPSSSIHNNSPQVARSPQVTSPNVRRALPPSPTQPMAITPTTVGSAQLQSGPFRPLPLPNSPPSSSSSSPSTFERNIPTTPLPNSPPSHPIIPTTTLPRPLPSTPKLNNTSASFGTSLPSSISGNKVGTVRGLRHAFESSSNSPPSRVFERRFKVQTVRKATISETFRWEDGEEHNQLNPGDVVTLIGMNEEEGMCAGAVNGKIASIPQRYLQMTEDLSSSPSSGYGSPSSSSSSSSFSSSMMSSRSGSGYKKTSTLPPPSSENEFSSHFSLSKSNSGWTRATATIREQRASITLGPNSEGPNSDTPTAADTLANIFLTSVRNSPSMPLKSESHHGHRVRSKSVESMHPAVEMARLLKQSIERDPLQKGLASGVVSLSAMAVLPLTNKSKDEVLRNEVISELIRTERDYVGDLELIIEGFLTPLRASGIVPDKDVKKIFSNVEVLHGINLQMLRELERRVRLSMANNVTSLGDIFNSMSDYLKMYTEYCTNQPVALECLKAHSNNRNFNAWQEICESDPRCRNLGLGALLIKPVQRICKYPLFLRELLRYTPQDHGDYQSLSAAEQRVNTILDYINERKRITEMQQKLMEIAQLVDLPLGEELATPTRRFVREGLFCMTRKGKQMEVQLFFFNDELMIAKQKPKLFALGRQKFDFVAKLLWDESKLLPPVDGDEDGEESFKGGFCILHTVSAQLYQLLPYKEEETALWVADIQKAIEESQKLKASRQLIADAEPKEKEVVLTKELFVQFLSTTTGATKKLSIATLEDGFTPEEVTELLQLFKMPGSLTPATSKRRPKITSGEIVILKVTHPETKLNFDIDLETRSLSDLLQKVQSVMKPKEKVTGLMRSGTSTLLKDDSDVAKLSHGQKMVVVLSTEV